MSEFTIFHATDLHPDGGTAFVHSVALARDAGARLFTVHARTPADGRGTRPMPAVEPLLASWGRSEDLDFTPVEHECCDDPADTLLDAVRRIQPDLLVVGTHQKTALQRLLQDSVSNTLVVNATLPTLLLPIGKPGFVSDTGDVQIRRVLIPVGSHEALLIALKAATELAERLKLETLEFHLLHVGAPGVLEDELVPEREGWTYRFQNVSGDLREAVALHATANDIDLVVMATRGQDGILDVFRGTHTQQTLRATSRPMLVVPM